MERLRENVPDRVLAVLNENYGKPVDGDKISEVVWGTREKISDNYIRALIERCRLIIPERIKNDKSALYSLYHSTSYMLTDRLEIGSWVSMPFEQDDSMSMLSPDDLNLIHQREVRPEYRLVSRISECELKLLSLICDLSGKSKNGYASTKELAMVSFKFADIDEIHCIRNGVCRLRKRIRCLNSVEIQSEQYKGYRIIKKFS